MGLKWWQYSGILLLVGLEWMWPGNACADISGGVQYLLRCKLYCKISAGSDIYMYIGALKLDAMGIEDRYNHMFWRLV